MRLRGFMAMVIFSIMSIISFAAIQTVGNVSAFEERNVGGKKVYYVKTTGGEANIIPYASDVVRVQWSVGSIYDKDEIAIAKDLSQWATVASTMTETATSYNVETSDLIVEIGKSPFKVNFKDKTGYYLSKEDRVEFDTEYKPKNDGTYVNLKNTGALPAGFKVKSIKEMPSNEKYFGFGEYTGPLEVRGKTMQGWNSDAYAWGTNRQIMYMTMPFFYGVQGATADHPAFSYGIFFNNPARPTYKFGQQSTDKYSFEAGDGQLDYYFFSGGKTHLMKNVLMKYSELTGLPVMLPKWVLGNHQARFSYDNQGWVEWLIDEFRKNDIPLDAVYLDIDYMDTNNTGKYDNLNELTFDAKKFPDPAAMVSRSATKGVKLIPLIESALTKGDPKYAEANSAAHFIKNNDGSSAVTYIFLGPSSWLDFTSTPTKNWWKGKLVGFLNKYPFGGIWNDLNEPGDEGGNPLDGLMWMDGKYGNNNTDTRRQYVNVKNTYANYGTKTTYDAMLEKSPNKRPFVVSRAGYPGIQKYAINWGGDNSANYEHLKLDLRMGLGTMISGQVNFGSDIGGFIGTCTPELITRWCEWASLSPFFRNHSQGGSAEEREPFRYAEPYKSAMINQIKFRYQMLPFLYTLGYNSTVTGLPMNTPVYFNYFADTNTHTKNEYDYIVGDVLLVSPVLDKGAVERYTYLPKGNNWYNWYTDEAFVGGTTARQSAPIGTLPIYAKDGAIIPMAPSMKYVGEFKPTNLDVKIWPNAGSDFTLYEDDGETFNYKTGEFAKTKITQSRAENKNITITIGKKEGTYVTGRTTYTFTVHLTDLPLVVSNSAGNLTKYFNTTDFGTAKEGYYYDSAKKKTYVKVSNVETSENVITLKYTNDNAVTWVGDIANIPAGTDILPTENLQVTVSATPVGKTSSVKLFYSNDNGATWLTKTATNSIVEGDKEKWTQDLGQYVAKTTLVYYFEVTDLEGNKTVSNNGGANYKVNIDTLPLLTWVGGISTTPLSADITDGDTVTITAKTQPLKAAVKTEVRISAKDKNGIITTATAILTKTGIDVDKDVWTNAIGKFAEGTVVEYEVVGTDSYGTVVSNGLIYSFTVTKKTNYVTTYPTMNFRGTPNSWGKTPMTVIADYTWELKNIKTGNSGTERFKFDVKGDWTINFGLNGVLAGSDIPLESNTTYDITFNDSTKKYTITKIVPTTLTIATSKATILQGDATFALPATGIYTKDGVATSVNLTWTPALDTSKVGDSVYTATYNGISVTFTLTVTQPTPPTLTVMPLNATISKGDTVFKLPATGVYTKDAVSSNVSLIWTPELDVNKIGTSVYTAVYEGITVSFTLTVSDSFKSTYSTMYFRGTPNSWGKLAMSLVGDYTWSVKGVKTGTSATERCKFDVKGDWTINFGLNGVLAGGDIPLESNTTYDITFNDSTKVYTLTKITVPTLTIPTSKSTVTIGDTAFKLPATGTYTKDGVSSNVNLTWSPILDTTKVGDTVYTAIYEGLTVTYTLTVSANLKSTYTTMFYRGTSNSWGKTAMTLIADYTWSITNVKTLASSTERFKVDVKGDWTTNFGDTNKDLIGELAGADLLLDALSTYDITFNDNTKKFTITKK